MSHPTVDPKIVRDPKDILSDEDRLYIKEWVKEHFVPHSLVNAFWHPFVKSEWHRQQERIDLAAKMKELDRDSRGNQ